MTNLDSQLDAIITKYSEIENQLSNQNSLDTKKLIELNR